VGKVIANEIDSPLHKAGMPSTLATETNVERAVAEDGAVRIPFLVVVARSTHTAQFSALLCGTAKGDDVVVVEDIVEE
jgi:type IV pilus biogenesis protein CpaD/CtpE